MAGKRRTRGGRGKGRKTLPGKRDIPAKRFINGAYRRQKGNAVRMVVAAARRGSEIIARKMGLK